MYATHAAECVVAANHAAEFQQSTWDTKALFLRMHIAISLIRHSVRPLRLVPGIDDPANDSDDLLYSPGNSDDNESAMDIDGSDSDYVEYGKCATCAGKSDLLMCGAWQLAFCNRKCQLFFAKKHGLHYL
jgi:hypothetical protein